MLVSHFAWSFSEKDLEQFERLGVCLDCDLTGVNFYKRNLAGLGFTRLGLGRGGSTYGGLGGSGFQEAPTLQRQI